VHADAPDDDATVPTAQLTQLVDEGAPLEAENVPAEQLTHVEDEMELTTAE